MRQIYLPTLFVIAQVLVWPVHATEHERVYIDKVVILSDRSIRVRCTERGYSTTWIDHDGVHNAREIISLEIVLSSIDTPTELPRCVWRSIRFRTDDNMITGTPVVDVVALVRQGENDQLLFAVANSYYPGIHVYSVDPRVIIPQLEEVYRQDHSGDWTPSLDFARPLLIVPSTNDARGGVRTIAIRASNDEVALVVNHAIRDRPMEYVYSQSTQAWKIEQLASEKIIQSNSNGVDGREE